MNSTKTQSSGPVINPEVTKRFAIFINNYVKDSQHVIAEKTGLNQGSISLMLNGKRGISFATTKAFMKAYNLNPEWLATGDPKEHPISKQTTETGGMMAKTLKEQAAEILQLKSALKDMEKAIKILEANQGAFIKKIEHFMDVMNRK